MIRIYIQVDKFDFDGFDFEASISGFAPQMVSLLEIDDKDFSIIVADDEFVKSINLEFRNKNYATDVLCFPSCTDIAELADGDNELGEIYISAETALRQADEFGITLEFELRRLVVHGVLHLMGFDHERSAKDRVIMRKKEDVILSLIM
jgi:probable rRNA maturation factor